MMAAQWSRRFVAAFALCAAVTAPVVALSGATNDRGPSTWVPPPTATAAPNVGQLGGQPCLGAVPYEEMSGDRLVPADAMLGIFSDYTPGCYSLRLLDASKGLPLAGFQAVDARHSTWGAVAPNGRHLAVLHWSSQAAISARIRVLDLGTWSQTFELDLKDMWRSPVWLPDSSGFLVVRTILEPLPPSRSVGGSYPAEIELWRVDMSSRDLLKVMTLPFESFQHVDVSADGNTLFFLAQDMEISTQWGWRPMGDQFLSVIDIASAHETARATIPSLSSDGGAELGYARYEAGVALSEATRRYYVAHADSDRISVINLDTMAVRQAEVSARALEPLPRRLLQGLESLFVATAEAKGGDSHTRQAEVTADGSLLIVAGTDYIEGTQDTGSRREPAGLRIIDTRTLRAVARDPDVTRFLLADDGRTVFATGDAGEYVISEERMAFEGIGLRVFDLASRELRQQVAGGTPFMGMALSRDGRYLRLLEDDDSLVVRDGICSMKCRAVTVSVFDTLAGEIVSEQVLPNTAVGFIGR